MLFSPVSKPRFRLASFAISTLLFACVGLAPLGFAQEFVPETAPKSSEESNPIAQLPDAPEEKTGANKPAAEVPKVESPTEAESQTLHTEPRVVEEESAPEIVSSVPGTFVSGPAEPGTPAANTSVLKSVPTSAGALAPDDGWDILDQPRKIESGNTPIAPQPVRTPIQSLFSSEPLRTVAARRNLALPLPQGRIVIDKSERRLDIYNGNTRLKSYRVALGSNPSGHKVRQGDGRTPEGNFYICTRNSKDSAFHIFLGLSYPALPDARRAVNSKQITWREYQMIHQRLASRGRPLWETKLGGWVGIHGGTDASFAQKKQRERGSSDWTAGCIALTNREIEEIHAATRLGTPVKVQP